MCIYWHFMLVVNLLVDLRLPVTVDRFLLLRMLVSTLALVNLLVKC